MIDQVPDQPHGDRGKAQQHAQSHRNRMAQRSRQQFSAVAEIGALPAVANRELREACRFDPELFLVEYFPRSTGLTPFSADHRRVIARMKRCILEGGRFANAVYRGFAKTTMAENMALWATFYGHRKFIPIFGANERAAKDSIESWKKELSENELLAGDFPEVCHAIWALENKPQRCASQTCNGELTHVQWTAEKIVLPSIRFARDVAASLGIDIDDDGFPRSAGAILTARGISGGSRGLKHKQPNGVQQRPDFVIIDDPQTDEEAASAHSVNKTLSIIRKSLLNLGGHRQRIAVVMNATVIEPDDVVDQLLDSQKNPAWQRERIPMVKAWSKAHETFWLGEYARIWRSYDPDLDGDQERAHAAATQLYASRRAEADEGAVVSWQSCYDETELSAIQHAYNKLIDDGPEAFASECQQAPERKQDADSEELSEKRLAAKLNGLDHRTVPLACDKLTAFVDVQGKLLYYVVCAWGRGYQGAVIDYGTYPDQRRPLFTLREASRTLQHVARGAGPEGAIYAGLQSLAGDLLAREWRREDGTLLNINRCVIDSGDWTETVHTVCRRPEFGGRLLASKGIGIKADRKPMTEYERKPGETHGLNAVIGPAGNGRRLMKIDTNWWKSFVASRLRTPLGDAGSLSIWGTDREAHRMFFGHLLSEYFTPTTGNGRRVEVWAQRPSRPDNHLWDCLVGAAAAACFEGVSLVGHEQPTGNGRRKVKLPGRR
ncbi:MAG: terminase gpA endonuclease subunit [Planctomycetaceae bacterium]|nr:terminase gpA endonuclease subunit [Planctomycetaceae bacterium]